MTDSERCEACGGWYENAIDPTDPNSKFLKDEPHHALIVKVKAENARLRFKLAETEQLLDRLNDEWPAGPKPKWMSRSLCADLNDWKFARSKGKGP